MLPETPTGLHANYMSGGGWGVDVRQNTNANGRQSTQVL